MTPDIEAALAQCPPDAAATLRAAIPDKHWTAIDRARHMLTDYRTDIKFRGVPLTEFTHDELARIIALQQERSDAHTLGASPGMWRAADQREGRYTTRG